MIKYKIVDERKDERKMSEFGKAVERRPFAVYSQVVPGGRFLAIPGAKYATRAQAEEVRDRLQANPNMIAPA